MSVDGLGAGQFLDREVVDIDGVGRIGYGAVGPVTAALGLSVQAPIANTAATVMKLVRIISISSSHFP